MSQVSEFEYSGVLRGEGVWTQWVTKEQATRLAGRPRQIFVTCVFSKDGIVSDHQSLGRPYLATKRRESQLCC